MVSEILVITGSGNGSLHMSHQTISAISFCKILSAIINVVSKGDLKVLTDKNILYAIHM